jgi:DNA-binding response OmpR family regulator
MQFAFVQGTVVIVHRSATFRREVGARLLASGVSVFGEESGVDLDRTAQLVQPDVAVVELDGDPEPILYQLRRGRDTAVVFVAEPDRAGSHRDAARRAGALDVLALPVDAGALSAAIISFLRSRSDRRITVGDLSIDEGAHIARRANAEVELTPLQFDLLVVFAQRLDTVLTKHELLNAVWGFDSCRVNLVEVHISALRRKLEANGSRLIHTVRGYGYVMREPQEHVRHSVMTTVG